VERSKSRSGEGEWVVEKWVKGLKRKGRERKVVEEGKEF
jgi:hypothetical protein